MNQNLKKVLVVAAVIKRDFDPEGKVLIVRRSSNQSGAGFWEFPGGKVEEGETLESALRREIDEELGISIQVGDCLGELEFSYPSKVICLKVYLAKTSAQEIELREHDSLKWCFPNEINKEELSPADRPFVDKLV